MKGKWLGFKRTKAEAQRLVPIIRSRGGKNVRVKPVRHKGAKAPIGYDVFADTTP